MNKKYYQSLAFAMLVCSIIPAVVYYLSIQHQTLQGFRETVYHFKQVDGPIQPIPQRIEIDKNWLNLGKALFHSPLLSKDNRVSCASCHMIDFGGDDGFPVSSGVDNAKGVRNSPTVLNSTFSFRQFWDGRASSLTEQVTGPIHNPIEMATSWPEIIIKLSEDSYFTKTFDKLSSDGITADNIIKAITIYEESLITPNSPIDRYLLGDESALSAQQKHGLDLFINYGCSTCHQGVNIGGNIYQKLGRINDIPQILTLDHGKYDVSQQEIDKYIFKVPTLRNIAETAPYFHNGAIDNLPDAVRIMGHSQLGRELNDDDVNDIVALLNSFSSKIIEIE